VSLKLQLGDIETLTDENCGSTLADVAERAQKVSLLAALDARLTST
jgi:hypothetical protein